MIHFVWLVLCIVAIYLSCEWFVNAVEWLGERLKIGKMAVGTVLAARFAATMGGRPNDMEPLKCRPKAARHQLTAISLAVVAGLYVVFAIGLAVLL